MMEFYVYICQAELTAFTVQI